MSPDILREKSARVASDTHLLRQACNELQHRWQNGVFRNSSHFDDVSAQVKSVMNEVDALEAQPHDEREATLELCASRVKCVHERVEGVLRHAEMYETLMQVSYLAFAGTPPPGAPAGGAWARHLANVLESQR